MARLSATLGVALTGEDLDREAEEHQWSEWMTKAQRGDEEAYAQLLTELAEMIKAYLLGRFGRLQMLDDCVQECLIAIHQARHTYDGSRLIRPWLFAIIRHKTIDMLRRQNTERQFSEAQYSSPTGPDPALSSSGAIVCGNLRVDSAYQRTS